MQKKNTLLKFGFPYFIINPEDIYAPITKTSKETNKKSKSEHEKFILWEQARKIFSDQRLNRTSSISDPGYCLVFKIVIFS